MSKSALCEAGEMSRSQSIQGPVDNSTVIDWIIFLVMVGF